MSAMQAELAAIGFPAIGDPQHTGGWHIATIRVGLRYVEVAHAAPFWRVVSDYSGRVFCSARELVDSIPPDIG